MTLRVAVLAVGTELLTGEIVNGNAAWLGEQLTAAGAEVVRSVMVGDDLDAIVDELRGGLALADAVVVTGGLGSTHDDLTRDAIAALAGVPLERSDALARMLRERFTRRGVPFPEINLRQADVPVGATTIDNPVGTAPGLRMAFGDGVVYAVPGVPAEMRTMVLDTVLADLLDRADGDVAVATRQLKVAGLPESTAAELIAPGIPAAGDDVTVAILASLGLLRIRATARGGDEAAAQARVDRTIADFRAALGDNVYGEGDDTLAGVTVAALRAAGATVATAESLTGGLVGGELTGVAGASAVFRGGIVAYDVEAKQRLLGVPADLLAARGPVDPDVAVAMAEGVRERLSASYGIGVTGVAGPEPHGGAQPGTVWCALAGPRGSRAVEMTWRGDRERVRTLTVTHTVDLLRRELAAAGNIGG